MVESETIYSTLVKYNGVFNFSEFYKFCYDYLANYIGLFITEGTYDEKIEGDSKTVVIDWDGQKKMTDYFQFKLKMKVKILRLKKVEINEGGKKIKMNEGTIELTYKADLARDWQGKFETDAFKKFLRGIYEKWVIPSRIDEYEGKIIARSDEFISQVKAYLDLEGKKK